MADVRDDLVRIDGQGVMHPIGRVASQRMRRHSGDYRCLPSPDHLVLLRYTGPDGQVDPGDGAIVRLAGEIVAPGIVCDVLSLLAQAGWRGVLSVHTDEVLRDIFVDGGNVIDVRSTHPEERLGRVLYRYGRLGEKELAQAEAEDTPGEGRRFGESALLRNALTEEALYQGLRDQVTEVVVGALRVGSGTFFFLDGIEDEEQLRTREPVPIHKLIMEGVTRIDEMSYFEQKIPTSLHVPVRVENASEVPPELALVWEQIDGRSSVAELGRKTGLGEFETTRQLFALIQSKHVKITAARLSGGPRALVLAANDVLALTFRRADELGRRAELTVSLSSFASGGGPLFSVLLQGAGPDDAGQLLVDKVVANLPLVAQGADQEATLARLLLDYVGFAIFSVGAYLGRHGESELRTECEHALLSLRAYG